MATPVFTREELREHTALTEEEIDIAHAFESRQPLEVLLEKFGKPHDLYLKSREIGKKLGTSTLPLEQRRNANQTRATYQYQIELKLVEHAFPEITHNFFEIWTEDAIDLVLNYDENDDVVETLTKIGHGTGFAVPSHINAETQRRFSEKRSLIRKNAHKIGSEIYKGKPHTDFWWGDTKDTFIDDLEAGLTLHELTEKYNRTRPAIISRIVYLREDNPFGKKEIHHNGKIQLLSVEESKTYRTKYTRQKWFLDRFDNQPEKFIQRLLAGNIRIPANIARYESEFWDLTGYNLRAEGLKQFVAERGVAYWLELERGITDMTIKIQQARRNVITYLNTGMWDGEQLHQGFSQKIYELTEDVDDARAREILRLRDDYTLQELGEGTLIQSTPLTRERVRQIETKAWNVLEEKVEEIDEFVLGTARALYAQDNLYANFFLDANKLESMTEPSIEQELLQ